MTLQDPLPYRQEILAPLFRLIHTGESGVVVGTASMGKSRLVQHLLHPEVRRHYLGEAASQWLFAWVDCNRMATISEWGLHELILTALLETMSEQPRTTDLRDELHLLQREVILTGNALLGQRAVELALRRLCHDKGLKICLVLDEFDESYRLLPAQTLANLRALRDANKYRVTYLLLTRDDPAQLRPAEEGEGFYELLSRSVLGLTPHTSADMQEIVQRIAARRDFALGPLRGMGIDTLVNLSGGHPGLVVALLDAANRDPPIGVEWLTWAVDQPKVQEECRKIWEGLRNQERQTLHHVAQGVGVGFRESASLRLKGLLRGEATKPLGFFSPLLQHYAQNAAAALYGNLHVDEAAGTVWVNEHRCEDLTGKEFTLLAYLHAHQNEICAVEQIISHLYPGPEGYNINDNAIAALIKRVRDKIEPNPKRPLYLKNIKGRGYQLVTEPA